MKETQNKKILYAASTQSHLEHFHQPYIRALKENATVLTMASGDQVDFPIFFDKHFFSFSNLISIFKIRKILKRERFDAVLLNTTLAAFLIRCAMLGMRKRPYVLNIVHGYLFPKEAKGVKNRILLLCEKLLRGRTDDIAVMNAEDLEIAQENRLCKNRVYFMNGMGVEIPDALPCPDRDLRALYTKTPSDFVCTFVGELSNRKNQIFLIDAAHRLSQEGIPVRLLLVGEGSERPLLEERIKELHLEDRVFLTGAKGQVLPYLAITDLYVSASKSEGLPFNVMEAMMCGLPILASDTKGQSDLLKADPDSLYPLHDMDAFCDAVRRSFASSSYGIGKKRYDVLRQYTLSSVFLDNMKILTLGLNHDEMEC